MEVGLEAANAGCQQRARPADDCLHRDRNFNRSGSTIRRVSDAIADRASTDWSSGDGWSVGLLKWWNGSDQNLAKVRSPAS